MKRMCLISLLFLSLVNSPMARSQKALRDSLINVVLDDFWMERSFYLQKEKECMFFVRSFPPDYNLSEWIADKRIGIAEFWDKKIIRKYKRTKRGIPTIFFSWEMKMDGSIVFILKTWYVSIRKKVLGRAFSESFIYCFTYSEQGKRWVLQSKNIYGV